MSFTIFIIQTVFSLLTMLLLLRAWMQFARVDFYNPLSQFVVRFTQPVIAPLRRIIPSIGPIDTASVFLAYVMIILKLVLLTLVIEPTLVLSPTYLLIALVMLIKAIGKMIFWALIMLAIMSWISRGSSPIEFALAQLTDPILKPIRRILPDTGPLDFSVMAAMFILLALNYLGTDITTSIGMASYWVGG